MIRQAYLSVVARNASWSGDWSCEPCECGWASEAIFFVRVLHADPGVHAIRVRHFGGWLRLAGHTEGGGEIRVVCYLHLKE
jgi:hypothetical protein